MSERLQQAAGLCDAAADELEQAASHCRTAANHFRDGEVPRGAAHAWAATGHITHAAESLRAQASDHARHAIP